MSLSKKSTWLTKANTGLIVIALVVFVLAALSGTGYANEWWDVRTAFALLRYAAFTSFALIAIAVLTLWGFAFAKARRDGQMARTVISAVLFLGVLGFSANILNQVQTARSVPPIHDVTTDLEDIPQYTKLNPQNPNAENWELLHRAGYADLQPLELDMSVADVIAKAEKASEAFGWEVAVADAENGRLEVTETTQWFQFKDDLVLRVRATEGGGSQVDARSVSRFAGSDIGVNAARIRKLFAAIQE
ncbi:DUF1499 domain-containing protein [Kordiimonas sp. SCSIO 12610]|uniref:DUF1499 domain-containing protein n=1 Tax=Kordiimonas sp. SCSIO 12610 TaxID=2829597 RepID=UPI00210DE237|nr:DUF1499 domain-containing protein [Kordiimonas sp. SCSIO 12610]UTW54591.1 DUF1499 domain-containing protein [Kordiimonas sp. SCSIO 12610]